MQSLLEKGELDVEDVDTDRILDFALSPAASLPDVAYRFCRDEPGVHVVLSGTGNADHLEQNLTSFVREPLSEETTQKLRHIFRSVVSTTGQSLD